MVETLPAPYWDPYDEAIDNDPYPVWRRLRDEAPVYRNDPFDFWALSRFEDVERAQRDTSTFSSAHNTVLENMGPERATTRMMIFVDPPDHTVLRSLVSRAFTPRRIRGIEHRVREIARALLDDGARSSSFDYIQEFAAQLPSRVISALVGVPPEDQERTRQFVDRMFHIEPGVGMANDVSASAALDLVVYLQDLIAERVQSPRDDLITALVQAEIDDDGTHRRLTSDECVEFAVLLYTAGTETVAKLLGNAAVVLAAHPEQQRALAADAGLIPNAVEELLRYEPPSPVNGRWTTRDVEVHGVTIPKDSKVLLLTGSAGRDERACPDADVFDVRRPPGHHLTFGYGPHFCIGAALARLEGRVALEETFARFPTWRVDLDAVERVHTSTVRGYRRVPVRV